MRTVTVSDSTYLKVQTIAVPLDDDFDAVVSRLAEAELKRRVTTNGNGQNRFAEDAVVLNPDAHEDLAFTKLLAAKVDGHSLHRPKWNGLREHFHVLALERLGSFEALQRASGANLREGRYEENGYKYLPTANISIQGVDANLSWSHSLQLARAIGVSLEAMFEWRDKEGAARPGVKAVLSWDPIDDTGDAFERRQRDLVELKAMVRVAEEEVAAGLARPFDPEAIKKSVRERLARKGITD